MSPKVTAQPSTIKTTCQCLPLAPHPHIALLNLARVIAQFTPARAPGNRCGPMHFAGHLEDLSSQPDTQQSLRQRTNPIYVQPAAP